MGVHSCALISLTGSIFGEGKKVNNLEILGKLILL